MWIKSNMHDCIVNSDHMVDVYCAGTDVIALVKGVSGKATVILGKYNGTEESRCALDYLFRNLTDVTKTLQMPSSDHMHALMINGNKPWHHATGNKTKGHGGS